MCCCVYSNLSEITLSQVNDIRPTCTLIGLAYDPESPRLRTTRTY